MIEKDWIAICQSVMKGEYKKPIPPNLKVIYDPNRLPPSTSGGLSDCGLKIDLSPSELYDQLRLVRNMTVETIRFMNSMCQAAEFEEHFGF